MTNYRFQKLMTDSQNLTYQQNDPRIAYFYKNQLRRLKKSKLTINEFLSRIFNRVEKKLSKCLDITFKSPFELFRKLYLDEKESIARISRHLGVNKEDLCLWVRLKHKIKIRTQLEQIRLDNERRKSKNKKKTRLINTIKRPPPNKQGRPTKPIPPEYYERYKNGEGFTSLAEELKIAPKTFKKALKSAGIKVRSKKESKPPKVLIPNDYIKRYQNGESSRKLAKELGISIDTFRKRVGVKLRNRSEAAILVWEMRQSPILPEHIERYLKGEAAKFIAKELNMSVKRFRQRLKDMGIILRGSRGIYIVKENYQPMNTIPSDYVDRYLKGEDVETLTKELGINMDTFYNRLTVRRPRTPLTDFPTLINEWFQPLNGRYKPEYFSAGSGFKAYWRCSQCNHIYRATVNSRTNEGGCLPCAVKRVKIDRRWKQWQDWCENLAKTIYKNLNPQFQKAYHFGKPDVSFPATSKFSDTVIDAKTNGKFLGDNIENYANYYKYIQVWCLKNPQETFYINNTKVEFFTIKDLLSRVTNQEGRTELEEELRSLLRDKFQTDLQSFKD